MTQRSDDRTAFRVLAAVSFCHLLNDMLQSAIPSAYPIFKGTYHLDFGQIGVITLTNQIAASLLQPLVGMYTDRRPLPDSLAIGMCVTLAGLLLLAFAPSYAFVLVAVACVGLVYRVCSFLPAIGVLTALLPDLERRAVAGEPRAAGT